MAYKITYSNFKGGTGKTTNSTMMGYHLAAKGFKTLLIDLDPRQMQRHFILLQDKVKLVRL